MNRSQRFAAWMAGIYGLGLTAFETLVNWGQWQWWPWYVVDYVAAGLLLLASWAAFARKAEAPLLLTAGWGFALGMMWMSLAGNLEQGTDPDRAARVAGLYVALIAGSMVYCLVGLVLTLKSARQSNE